MAEIKKTESMNPKKNNKRESVVGIAMATYNPDLRFFRLQIDSLLRQTHENWVCVIVDDASDEKIFKHIGEIVGHDPRFKLIKNDQNSGSFKSFETALIRLPPCDYICFCDQDDIWQPHKLSHLTELLSAPEVSFVHSDQTLIDEHGDLLARSCWDEEGRYVPRLGAGLLLFRNTVAGCAVMFKAEVLRTALPFPDIPTKQQPYYHDVWVAMHACIVGMGIALKEPLVFYRQHRGNLVGSRVSRRGVGLHLPTLLSRSKNLYQARRKLKEDFTASLARKGMLDEKINEAVSFTDSFWALCYRSLYYSIPNPKFFKTGMMLLLGCAFSRRR